MPTVSAACGCSPTARRRSPQRVRNIPNQTSATAMYMRYTMIVWRNSTGPMTGISLRIGIGMRSKRGGEFSSAWLGCSTCE